MTPVTDPGLLAQLDSGGPRPVTDQALLAQLEAEPNVAMDVAKSAGIGVVKGGIGILGMPGDIGSLVSSGADAVAGRLGLTGQPTLSGLVTGEQPDNSKWQSFKKVAGQALTVLPFTRPFASGPTSQELKAKTEEQTGKFYEPQTIAGQYAQTVGEFVPAAAAGPGGIARRLAAQTLVPGVTSEAAGQATKGTAAEPYARVAAALAAGPAAGRVITPLPVSQGRQRMLDVLEAEGITPTAGQRTGSTPLKYAESSLGDFPLAGNRATAAQELSQEQFTRAALRRMGVQGDPTRGNVDLRVRELQDTFRDLSTRNTLQFDRQFVADLTNTATRYTRKLPSQQREVFQNYIDDITRFPGQIPGDVYQVARSDLSRQAHALRHSDPTLSDALRGVRNTLDNAMERSIPPADRAAWREARRQWGNWRTLEGPAKLTDEAGNIRITPAALQQAASSRDRGQFARGLGDFAELSQAAAPVLKAMPQSGTTPRAVASGILSGIGGAAGGIPGAMAGIAVPAVAGRALMSRPVQAYLGNQLLARGGDRGTQALIRALIADQSSDQPLRLTVRPGDAQSDR